MTDPHALGDDGLPADGLYVHADRYVFDEQLSYAKGWCQMDTRQDASYFGVWVQLFTRKIATYCEGDFTIETVEDDEKFTARLMTVLKAYDPEPDAADARPTKIDVMLNADMHERAKALGLGDRCH
jgi:hypothetical protein